MKARSLVSLASAQEASIVKHVLGQRVQSPVVALARVPRLPGDLDEAVVERQVVPDAVLPGGELFAVVGEPVSDELADAAEGQSLVGRLKDGHGDQSDVRIRRLDHAVLLPRV